MSSSTTKYDMLLRVLDALRAEAADTKWEIQYAVGSTDGEQIRQARTKAYIHLYLKVMFGLSDFAEREGYVTDESNDGGIDGYYIDRENKRIYLLQSKFRNNEKNLEQKEIDPKEILVMDIDRITRGNQKNTDGTVYNGKIQGLIRAISETADIARYNYHVIIIANCSLSSDHIRKLTDGFPATVFNFERSYGDLLFPIVSGTFFKADDVVIKIDLANKSAGAKTSYTVDTPDYLCEITVLFFPTLEIARVMDRYRNSILEYNPRSYVDLQDGRNVHSAIRETLLRPGSNEFALMNNGLTIMSDETNLSERIGQHNKAQLRLLKPQIINGGQTAYTLSRIYGEDKAGAASKFAGKEVLAKIITLTAKTPEKDTAQERLRLIDEISASSNRQAPVVIADRMSNDGMYIRLQNALFDQFGILYERKRGEFSDGIKAGYIDEDQIMERNLFLRIFLASKGDLNLARRKRIFVKHTLSEGELVDQASLEEFADALAIFKHLLPRRVNGYQPRYRNLLAKVYIGVRRTNKSLPLQERIAEVEAMWSQLVLEAAKIRKGFGKRLVEPSTGLERHVFSEEKWTASDFLESDVRYFVLFGRLGKPMSSKTEEDEDFESLLNESLIDLEGIDEPRKSRPNY